MSGYPSNKSASLVLAGLLIPLLAGAASAATVLDLGRPGTPPALPTAVDAGNQPVYITNSASAGVGTPVSGAVDYLRVGAGFVAHVGYDNLAIAQGDVGLSVGGTGNAGMLVEGEVRLGKGGTSSAPGLPNAATAYNLHLGVAGDLTLAGGRLAAVAATPGMGTSVAVSGRTSIDRGGLAVLTGSANTGMATFATDSLSLSGGSLVLNAFSWAKTMNASPLAGSGQTPWYSVDIGGRGMLVLNSGIGTGAFTGLDVSAGGDGVRVAGGGILTTGGAGGIIAGMSVGPGLPGQRLAVERGGVLDASRGSIRVDGINAVDVAGNYFAGYNTGTTSITRMVAPNAAINLLAGSSVGMGKELQKELNRRTSLDMDTAAILRGGDIVFASGSAPVVQSALGQYSLALGRDSGDQLASLWVNGIRNGVLGSGTAEDMAVFRENLEAMPWQGRVNADMAADIYTLAVSDLPGVTPRGEAGALNAEVFDAFVAGYGQRIGDRGGVADDGIFELYNGAVNYGTSRVAYNAAAEMAETVGQRLGRVRGDLAQGDGVASDQALAQVKCASDQFENRFWIGGFARREEADLDYGIAGYKYEPAGLVMGYDRAFGRFGVGGAVAYAEGDYTDKAAAANDSTIASYSASVYGTYAAEAGFNASAFATYSYLDNDMSDIRGNLHRRADYNGAAWSAGARIGYDASPTDRLTLSPSLGVTRVEARNQEHDEFLDGVKVIRVGEVQQHSTLLPLELGVGYDVFRGEASLFRLGTTFGYAYDLDNDGVTGDFLYEGLTGASPVPVADRDAGRHRFHFGAEAVFSYRRLDVAARYDYFRRSGEDAQQLKGSLGLKF